MKKHSVKILGICLAFFICMTFTSCYDFVQSISYQNGQYQYYYKFTLSKAVFSLAEENPKAFLYDLMESSSKTFPEKVQCKPIETDTDVGIDLRLWIDPKTEDEVELALLPKIEENKVYIPFILGFEEFELADTFNSYSDEEFQMAAVLLTSSKCRIMVAKNVVPSIEIAYFEGFGGQNYSVPVFDYGDTFCIEIPFAVILDEMYNIENLVVIKGKE